MADETSEYTAESPGIQQPNGVSTPVENEATIHSPGEVTEIPEEARYYTTIGTGITIRLNPVSPILIGKMNDALQQPPVPRYKVETVAGITEWHDHDESTIAEDDTPEEEKQAWVEYKKKIRELDQLRAQRFMDLFMSKGIDFEMPDGDEWAETQELLGVTIPPPEKRLARKIHYLQTEVLTTQDDITEVMQRVMAMTGVGNKALSEARSLFRRSVQRKTPLRMDATNGA